VGTGLRPMSPAVPSSSWTTGSRPVRACAWPSPRSDRNTRPHHRRRADRAAGEVRGTARGSGWRRLRRHAGAVLRRRALVRGLHSDDRRGGPRPPGARAARTGPAAAASLGSIREIRRQWTTYSSTSSRWWAGEHRLPVPRSKASGVGWLLRDSGLRKYGALEGGAPSEAAHACNATSKRRQVRTTVQDRRACPSRPPRTPRCVTR
jgi:hypothetical protein